KEGDELVGRAGRGHKRAEFIGRRLSLQESNQTSVRVVCEQQPLLFNDAQNGQTARDVIVERLDAYALLGVPLVRDGDVLGALILTYVHAANQFEPADLKVATIFGQQAAMALTHAHLYATVKRQLYELSTLLAISTTLRQATGQEKVVEGLLSQAVGTLSVAGGAVHLIDSERGEVEAVRALGVMASQQKQRLPLEGSLTAHVVEQRRPYFSNGHAEAEPGAEKPKATNGNGHGILTLPMQAGETAVGALSLAFPSSHEPSGDDLRLAQTIAEIGGMAIQRVALYEKTEQQAAALAGALSELRGSYQATLRALSVALDARDRETEGHSQRVTNYAMQLARALNMANCETLEPLEWGALLHDVGKIGVPDAILLKPAALTEEEWQIMRRHPETGHAILRGIPFLHGALDVVLSHHEHWDGSGYPSGLRGDDIPLFARIFAVADALDAITTARPYRVGRSFSEARTEIVCNGGSQFDPAVVAAYQGIPDTEWQALAGRLPPTG
ncbi:MAG TPA: HD domain-containing phosphohydrolase, partial [Chloroflexota bacterium]|nr:HD domain-containing phosphohydrolase [Chloroflexota bacterium]